MILKAEKYTWTKLLVDIKSDPFKRLCLRLHSVITMFYGSMGPTQFTFYLSLTLLKGKKAAFKLYCPATSFQSTHCLCNKSSFHTHVHFLFTKLQDSGFDFYHAQRDNKMYLHTHTHTNTHTHTPMHKERDRQKEKRCAEKS